MRHPRRSRRRSATRRTSSPASRALAPDFLFSFYYRQMLEAPLLATPPARRAQHARLAAAAVPRSRAGQLGGAPRRARDRRDAALHDGEARRTATSSRRPRVPILPDDTAREVFDKVTVAAEITLDGVLPALIAGTAPRRPQDPALALPTSAAASPRTASSTGAAMPRDSQPGARRGAALPGRVHGRRLAGMPARPCSRTRIAPIADARARGAGAVHRQCGDGGTLGLPGSTAAAWTLRGAGRWRFAGAACDAVRAASPARFRHCITAAAPARAWPGDAPGTHVIIASMRKILILGVNGFIGHHLSQRILATPDWEVYGMDMQSDRVADLLPTSASTSSKATSRSTRSGSSTTSRSATRSCRWWRSRRRRPTSTSRCACSSSTSRPTCRSCGPASGTRSASSSRRPPRSTACAATTSSIPKRSELVLGPINKPRWIYACAKQLMDRVIHAYGMQEGLDYTLFRPFNWIGSGLDSINTAKEGSSRVDHAVPRPHRPRRADQARRRRHAEARLHLHRRRHRRADDDHRQRRRRRDGQDLQHRQSGQQLLGARARDDDARPRAHLSRVPRHARSA